MYKSLSALLIFISLTSYSQPKNKKHISAWTFDLGMESSLRYGGGNHKYGQYFLDQGFTESYEQFEFFLPLGFLGSAEYVVSQNLSLSLDFSYHHLPTYTDRYFTYKLYSYSPEIYEIKSDEIAFYSDYIRTGIGLKMYFNKAPIGGYLKLNTNFYSTNSEVHRTTISESSYHYEGQTSEPIEMVSSALGLSLEWGKRKVIGDRLFADFGIRYSKPIISLSNSTYDAMWYKKVFVNNEIQDYFPSSNIHYRQFKNITAEFLQVYLKFGIIKMKK